MKVAGWLLIAGGVLLVLFAVQYDPSVSTAGDSALGLPERVINTGELAKKEMIFQSGLAVAIMGMIGVAADWIREGLSAGGRAASEKEAAQEKDPAVVETY